MARFSTKTLENRAFCNRALAFNTQLPIGGYAGTKIGDHGTPIPEAVKLLPNGNALITFFAPTAKEILIRFLGPCDPAPMEKTDSGLWKLELPYTTPGIKTILFIVDGTEVINPLAPICFSSSQPVNYIEFPEENCDFYTLKDVPHGTITQEFFYSEVTGQFESCMLYLPPSYMTSPETFYPVLYLQHGHGENEKCWLYQGKVNFIMDNLLAAKECTPCIVVMNNGMVHTKDAEGNMKMDSSLLESLLVKDCIPFIEKRYRIKGGKENRAMAGLSMGSMQTSITAMNHPELFDYVGIFSGFLRTLSENDQKNLHLKALDDSEDFKKRYKLFMRAMGHEDQFMPVFQEDNELLIQKGLSPQEYPAHKIFYYPGGHEWQVWRKCIRDFFKQAFTQN